MDSTSHLMLYPSLVIKLFTDEGKYYKELHAYTSALPHTSHLVSYGKADFSPDASWYISITRIHGESYLDVADFDPALLGKSLAEFHKASMQEGRCLCHIDNQPQNILASEEGYFFIDFSDSRYEEPEMDITHLLLFWAEQFEAEDFALKAASFLAGYQAILPISSQSWKSCLENSIQRFSERRKQYGKPEGFSIFRDINRQWLREFI